MADYISEIITDTSVLAAKGDEGEVPIRIEKHGNGAHKTETRIFARQIHEHFCDQPDCQFYGKHASQGNCWDATDPEEKQHPHYLDYVEHVANEWIEHYRKDRRSDADYIGDLEGALFCNVMNYHLTLDECVRLRAENARLKIRLGEYK